MRQSTYIVAVAVLIVTLFTQSQFVANGDDKAAPADNPAANLEVQTILERAGYIRVPIRQNAETQMRYIDLQCQGKTLSMLLDTGSSALVIELNKAKDLGFSIYDNKSYQLVYGGKVFVKDAHVVGLSVGGIEIPPLKWGAVPPEMISGDAAKGKKILCDGVFGMPLMAYYSAVIDIGTNGLFLLDPVAQEKDLQGEWVAYSLTLRGMTVPILPKVLHLTFDGIKMMHRYDGESGRKSADYSITLGLDKSPKWMEWIGNDFAQTLLLYEMTKDGELHIAMPNQGVGLNVRPDKMLPGPEDNFMLYRFRKVKKK